MVTQIFLALLADHWLSLLHCAGRRGLAVLYWERPVKSILYLDRFLLPSSGVKTDWNWEFKMFALAELSEYRVSFFINGVSLFSCLLDFTYFQNGLLSWLARLSRRILLTKSQWTFVIDLAVSLCSFCIECITKCYIFKGPFHYEEEHTRKQQQQQQQATAGGAPQKQPHCLAVPAATAWMSELWPAMCMRKITAPIAQGDLRQPSPDGLWLTLALFTPDGGLWPPGAAKKATQITYQHWANVS